MNRPTILSKISILLKVATKIAKPLGFSIFLTTSTLITPALAAPIDIEDLYTNDDYSNFSLSPSGQFLAFGDNRDETATKILVIDLNLMKTERVITIGAQSINWVRWATDERLLLSLEIKKDLKLPPNTYTRDEDGKRSKYFRDVSFARMIAMNRDGTNAISLMKDADRDLRANFRLDRITSILPNDPDNVLVPAQDKGLNLYKVNLNDGSYEKVQDGKRSTFAYDVNRNGYAIARYDAVSRGRYVKVSVRSEAEEKWTKLVIVREEDLANFSPVADTNTPGQIFVSAIPEGSDRAAIYRYDLVNKTFLEQIASHPKVDVKSVLTDFSNNYVGTVFTEHRKIYDFVDPQMDRHLKALNTFFSDEVNVSITQISGKNGHWLVHTSGPEDPGSISVYNPERKELESVVSLNSRLDVNDLSPIEVINYKASDGLALSGYLTKPKNAIGTPPLLVLVHGGPEARDYYDFDHWSQYLASHGYAVFQPQFRGSSGFGQKFAEAGFGEWGGRMQDDVTDGVEHLVKTGKAKRESICIAGASFGGYTALMGAIKTPDLYQCATSIAGVTDLIEQSRYDRDYFGRKSELYDYVKKQMGDPKKEVDKMISLSPARQANEIRIPIQIIQGTEDGVVPLEQAEYMRDALISAKNPAEYIELDGVNHGLWGGESRLYGHKTTLENLREFLDKHLKSPSIPQKGQSSSTPMNP